MFVNYDFTCKTMIYDKLESWNVNIKSIIDYNTYYEVIVEARGSSILILVGSTNEYNWISLPIQEVSCSLSQFDDIFWNIERLTPLIGIVDASTVVNTIATLDFVLTNHHQKQI